MPILDELRVVVKSQVMSPSLYAEKISKLSPLGADRLLCAIYKAKNAVKSIEKTGNEHLADAIYFASWRTAVS